MGCFVKSPQIYIVGPGKVLNRSSNVPLSFRLIKKLQIFQNLKIYIYYPLKKLNTFYKTFFEKIFYKIFSKFFKFSIKKYLEILYNFFFNEIFPYKKKNIFLPSKKFLKLRPVVWLQRLHEWTNDRETDIVKFILSRTVNFN